jgi:[ribosomal protein S5]-alanine N-acetyltransferase
MLSLVPLGAPHAPALLRLVGDHAKAPWRITPERSPVENVLAFVARAQRLRARRTHEIFAVFDADRLIGVVTLAGELSVAGHAELGYWFAEPERCRGHATAAARQLLSRAFGPLDLALVFARCPSANRASARVLEKLGFRVVASEPGQTTSGLAPVQRYELTRHEWLGRGI